MISISEIARLEILKVLNHIKTGKESCLRIGIKGTSCEGGYIFGIDTQNAEDELFIIDDIPIIISKKHLIHVVGCHVDYNDLNGDRVFSVKRL